MILSCLNYDFDDLMMGYDLFVVNHSISFYQLNQSSDKQNTGSKLLHHPFKFKALCSEINQ